VPYSLVAFGLSLILQYLFIQEFGLVKGGAYSAFIQNFLMSVLFLALLQKRQSSEGQSMLIAIAKFLGTLVPTILFGLIGDEDFGGPNRLILCLGICCAVFDIVYIRALSRVQHGRTKPYLF